MRKIYERLSPLDKVLISFLILIIIGSLLLMLPFCTKKGISYIDALFTSTSAVCVTGLVVADTSTDFTFIGQLVILMLIQFGGLGIMTFSVALLTLMGQSISIKWRFTLQSMYSDVSKLPIRNILTRIIIYTFTIEGVISAILFTQFIQEYPLSQALWHSIFHSISAYCNAGFSTFTDSLVRYNNNAIVIGSIALAIVLGGIGFLTMTELTSIVKPNSNKIWKGITLHSRIVLIATLVLIIGGMVVFFALEYNGVLKEFTIKEKLLASFFQSVTARTAGFNTVNIGDLREATCLFLIFLMFIGGSPGSIAGGVKTSTFVILWIFLIAKLKGSKQVVLFERALTHDNVEKAITLVISSILFILFSTFFFLVCTNLPKGKFLHSVFEVTSAFGTVGLSMGITPYTGTLERILLCCVMYIGRLGPLTLISALTMHRRTINIEYAEDHIMIG